MNSLLPTKLYMGAPAYETCLDQDSLIETSFQPAFVHIISPTKRLTEIHPHKEHSEHDSATWRSIATYQALPPIILSTIPRTLEKQLGAKPPYTFSTTVLGAVISHRTLPIPSRAAGKRDFDLHVLQLADDSATAGAFKLSVWVKACDDDEDGGGRAATVSEGDTQLRQALQIARTGSVVLARNVRLSQWQGNVQGRTRDLAVLDGREVRGAASDRVEQVRAWARSVVGDPVSSQELPADETQV